jgi:hypothetical protein
MARPVTLFVGQAAAVPIADVRSTAIAPSSRACDAALRRSGS